jgi:hypothetical protein
LKEKRINSNGAGSLKRLKEGANPGLNDMAVSWPTPNSRDHKGSDLKSRRGGASLSHFAQGGERSHPSLQDQEPKTSGPESLPQDPIVRRRLNPKFVSWLMGWPIEWSDLTTSFGETRCGQEEMESYLSRQRTLLCSLLERLG